MQTKQKGSKTTNTKEYSIKHDKIFRRSRAAAAAAAAPAARECTRMLPMAHRILARSARAAENNQACVRGSTTFSALTNTPVLLLPTA